MAALLVGFRIVIPFVPVKVLPGFSGRGFFC